MEDGNAETAIRVDVWVVERPEEFEICRIECIISNADSVYSKLVGIQGHTWRTIGVVFREGHLGLEVAAIVEGIRVQHDERYAPLEDVVIDKL